MRWPWQKTENRSAAGDYTAAAIQLIEGRSTAAIAGKTAAIEAAAGMLSRAFMSAEVDAPDWVVEAITPTMLALIGRDLVRVGASMHAIRMPGGRLQILPCSSWHWQSGSSDPASWRVRATAHGPSTSETWHLSAGQVIFMTWGTSSIDPYRGIGPTGWASAAARLNAESERSLANEAAGPLAQLIAVPQDGGDGEEGDPLASLKADITAAQGKALLVETVAEGWGEGQQAAPRKDWIASRLGPNPPAGMVQIAQQAFERELATCGTPPSLFTDSDGTSQREAIRRWHLGTVMPLARQLEHELSQKLETRVRFRFDGYPKDMVSRSQVFKNIAAAEGMTPQQALELSGLIEGDDG